MRIVLLGAPGAGKGTQATRLTDHYGIPRISVTSLLRKSATEETGSGRLAKAFLDIGHAVPDEIISLVLKERLQQPDVQQGFLLAGYPRTAAQADTLDEILTGLNLPLDLVLLLEGDHDHFMERLEGRQSCRSCGATYNIFSNPPRVDGVCDQCGGRMRGRADDSGETIANRMRIYEAHSTSLIQYYRLHGKLRQIDADADADKVFQALCAAIDDDPPTVVETIPASEPAVSARIVDLPEPAATDDTGAPRENREPEVEVKPKSGPKRATSTKKKKSVSAKKAVKKPAAKKKSARKKTAAKKAAGKKATAKKVATKKSAAKKATSKKVPAKKTATKKAVTKKSTAKKSAAKKAAIKKERVTKKKAAAKKVPAKKKTAKKSAVDKSAPKKRPAAKKKAAVKRRKG